MLRGVNLLNPSSWSLGVKFFAGLVLLGIIMAVLALGTFSQTTNEIGLENSGLLVKETGTRQAAAIANALALARDTASEFTASQQNQLFGLLLHDVRISQEIALPTVSAADLVNSFQTNLLLQPASLFDSVRLLDRNGGVLAQANRSTPLAGTPTGARAPAYIAGSNAAQRGEDRTISISQVNFIPLVEQIEVLRWRDGSPLGYLVTQLNNRRVFFEAISVPADNNPYKLQTLLVSSNHVLISEVGVRPDTLNASSSVAVDRAISGQTGSAIYDAEDGNEYIGYYSQVRGAQLGLVTQVRTADAIGFSAETFSARRFALGIGLIAIVILTALLFNQIVTPSLNRLRRGVLAAAYGDLDAEIPETQRRDEIGALATGIDTLREQVRGQISELEASVAARARDIDATQEISRFAATQRDLQRLMDSVVNLIIQRFPNIYHAQIFLVDADGQDAILRASTGSVGQELLRRGHRLGVGSVSVIGQVTSQGQTVIARDTAVSQVHRRNEFLPDTRAELAVPLRVGDTIIGALDVQSRERDAFAESQASVLQTMADQIAVAIQNARLYEDVTRRLQDIEDRNRRATLRAWQDFMRERRSIEVSREAGVPSDLDLTDMKKAALMTGELVVGRTTARQTIPVAVPIGLRGQTLGVVEWEIPVGVLSEDKLELARELAGRLAISLDNARLFQESQRTAERERIVNNIVAKLTAQTSIDDILQTAVREVGQALRAPQVSIRLHTSAVGSGEVDNGNGNGNGSSNGNGSGVKSEANGYASH